MCKGKRKLWIQDRNTGVWHVLNVQQAASDDAFRSYRIRERLCWPTICGYAVPFLDQHEEPRGTVCDGCSSQYTSFVACLDACTTFFRKIPLQEFLPTEAPPNG